MKPREQKSNYSFIDEWSTDPKELQKQVNETFEKLGFEWPETETQLEQFNEAFANYPSMSKRMEKIYEGWVSRLNAAWEAPLTEPTKIPLRGLLPPVYGPSSEINYGIDLLPIIRANQIERALRNLVALKEWKELHGPDHIYLSNKDSIWKEAKRVLEPMKKLPAIRGYSLPIEPISDKLDRLVELYNSQEFNAATPEHIGTMNYWRREIDTILNQFPELGPVSLKKYNVEG